MAKLSVIVPVYNVEDCLEWCLNSLRAQTMSDIEIICVNDGSTDASRSVLAACAYKDPRIIIIDKENGGLSSARNVGIAHATSPYLCFLDSDDRFVVNACERIVSVFERTGADVVTFGANPYPLSAGYPWLNDVLSPRDIVYEGFHPDILFVEKSRPFVWRTACRTALLRETGLLFVDGFGEDQVFDFALYPRSRKTVFISDKLYDYRVSRNGSLMDRNKKDPYLMLCEHIDIVAKVFEDWSNTKIESFYGVANDFQDGRLLKKYSAEMVGWVVELVLYDALGLPSGKWLSIASQASRVISSYWSDNEVRKIELPAATLAIVLAALKNRPPKNLIVRSALMMRYYVQRYGKRAFLSSIRRYVKA